MNCARYSSFPSFMKTFIYEPPLIGHFKKNACNNNIVLLVYLCTHHIKIFYLYNCIHSARGKVEARKKKYNDFRVGLRLGSSDFTTFESVLPWLKGIFEPFHQIQKHQ